MLHVAFRLHDRTLWFGEIGERLGKGLGRGVDRIEEGHLLAQNLFLEEWREYNSSNARLLQALDRVETDSERGWARNKRIRKR